MRYQNKQICGECLLVSLWNAARYYRINKIPIMGSKRYYKICENSGCIIDKNKPYIDQSTKNERKRLGLKYEEGIISLKWIKSHLPARFSILTKNYNFHSILCVNVKKNKLCLANYAEGRLYWINWKSLKEKIRSNPCQVVKEKIK
jgi:hypothetical protein